MKTKVEKEKMVKVPEANYLSLVADKLKDRVLFPEKVENAKRLLSNVKTHLL
jgi:hypothetical protein